MNEQFLKRMQGYLQEEYEEYLKTLDEDAYRGLRVNTAKLSVDQFHDLQVCACQPSSICPESFYIPKDIKGLGNHPAHLAGLFYMQEPSAASAVEVLDVQRDAGCWICVRHPVEKARRSLLSCRIVVFLSVMKLKAGGHRFCYRIWNASAFRDA